MGRWRQEQGPYGEEERWIPDFRGEWPDVPEPPCPVCSGELVRRTTTPAAGQSAFRRRRLEAQHAAAVRMGLNPPPLPEPEPVQTVVIYRRSCYRGPHGWTRPAGDGERTGGAALVGSMPELARAARTGDWSGPQLVTQD